MLTLLLSTLSLLPPAPPVADDPPLSAWTFGSVRGEVATCVAQLEGGDLLLSGFAHDGRHNDIQGWDAWLARIDGDGRLRWSRTEGGPGPDHGWSVRALPDGGALVAGVTSVAAPGGTDAVLRRLDAQGQELWARQVDGGGADEGWCALPLADGGLLLVCQVADEQGDIDALVVAHDGDGRERWRQRVALDREDRLFSAAQLTGGDLVVVGFCGPDHGDMDLLRLRLSPTGERRLLERTSLNGFDVAHDVRPLADGGYVMVGYTDVDQGGNADPFLYRFDARDQLVWSTLLPGPDADRALHLDVTPDERLVVTGYSLVRDDRTRRLLWLEVDAAEGQLLERRLLGPPGDAGRFVAALPDGRVVVVGTSARDETLGDQALVLIQG